MSPPPLSVEIEKLSSSDAPTPLMNEDFEAGDFIDDDFGLSLKLEAENIRQKQMQIEQEVRRAFSADTSRSKPL